MTVPLEEVNRGAWTAIGKDNGSKYYEYIQGKNVDGGTPEKSVAHEAVNLGIRGIQSEVNALGSIPQVTVDGMFGLETVAAVKWAQRWFELTEDGVAGRSFCNMLWRRPLLAAALKSEVPAKYLYGQMLLESGGDPAACGPFNERGLVQINVGVHKEITNAEAHDPRFALNYGAKRMAVAMKRFESKPELQVICMIASHNTPAKAMEWFETGVPPNPTIENYVKLALERAERW